MNIQALIDSENLYLTEIAGQQILWRLLSMKECRILTALRDLGRINDQQANEEAFKRAYVGNYDMLSTHMLAGVTSSIGAAALWMSGESFFETIKEDIIYARQYHPRRSVIEKMKRIIMIAFPSYTPDTIDGWSRVKLLERFAAAEALIIEKGFPYEPFNVEDIGKDSGKSDKKQTIKTEAENAAMEAAYHNQMEGATFWEKTPAQLSGKSGRKKKSSKSLEGLSSRDIERIDRLTQN